MIEMIEMMGSLKHNIHRYDQETTETAGDFSHHVKVAPALMISFEQNP